MAEKRTRTLERIVERSRTGPLKPHDAKYYINNGTVSEYMPYRPPGGTLVVMEGPDDGINIGDGYTWARIAGPHLTQVGWAKDPANTILQRWTRFPGPDVPVKKCYVYILDGDNVANKRLVHFL